MACLRGVVFTLPESLSIEQLCGEGPGSAGG